MPLLKDRKAHKTSLTLGFILLLFLIIGAKLGAQTEISLNTVSWKYIKQDGANFAYKNINDSAWEILPQKRSGGPIHVKDTNALWLRGKVYLSATNKRLGFLLEKVCGQHQVYLNGKLLPEPEQKSPEKKSYFYCPRHALHPIPFSFFKYGNGRKHDRYPTS